MESIIASYSDLWTNLSKCEKPVLLYGMGDGADKVIDVCETKGIKVSGVFASDGFVKKKIFRGFEVTSLSSALEKYEDPVILVSFASSLADVMNNIKSISHRYQLYCPDVPVFGQGLFDRDFVMSNIQNFQSVYNMLSDEKSRNNYVNLVLGKMTGDINFLINAESCVEEAYSTIIQPNGNGHYVDIGAYNGDTVREYLHYAKTSKTITAFEPDANNFKKLCQYADDNGISRDRFYNIAAWDKEETLTFYSRSGRNSAGTTSHKNLKSTTVKADAADNYIDSKVDFINIDAEGSDLKVLQGLERTVSLFRPCISCAIYHRNEDFFTIPLKLKEMYGDCRMYIRHFPYFPAWDTNVYVK